MTTTSPPQAEPPAGVQIEPPAGVQIEPPAGVQAEAQTRQDAGASADTASYAWLFDSLSRAATTGPWWRRWWNTAVDVVQSSWHSGFATLTAAKHSPQRRWFTILAAGVAAVVLSTTGVIAAVQENWTPTRISDALKFDEPEPPPPDEPAEPANAPAERPGAARLENPPPADDERGAGADDDAGVPVAARKRAKTRAESSAEQPRSRRSRRDGDAAGSGNEREADQEAGEQPEPESADPAPAGAAPQPARAPRPAAPTRDWTLDPGQTMRAGDRRESANGNYTLVMQPDGNLVAYRNGDRAVWSAGTAGNSGAYAVNQTDGNIVVYNATRALWSTKTSGKSGAVLVMQDDGNVVVYAGGGSVWSSGTAQ